MPTGIIRTVKALISRMLRRQDDRDPRCHGNSCRSLAVEGIDPEVLSDDSLDIGAREAAVKRISLSSGLADNLHMLKLAAGPSPDVSVRRLTISVAGESGERAPSKPRSVGLAIVHLGGIVDQQRVEDIVRSISLIQEYSTNDPVSELSAHLIRSTDVKTVSTFDEMWNAITQGSAIIMVDGHVQALSCGVRAFKTRQVEEPPTDTTLRGPRQGFVEDLSTNIALLRQWIRTPNLWIEEIELGSLTRTPVVISYIKGLASEELLAEVRRRVERIDSDSMLGAGPLEDFIQDTHLSFFPLMLRTERPDRVVGNLLEGRVALLVQNSPFALIVPMDYGMLFQAADDYYEPVPIVFVVSLLRIMAFWASILLPGTFVAIMTFHIELLPTLLLLRIVGDRVDVPFPVVLEVFLMELTFELLREAGLRLPRAVGSAVTIVGALVLGEAAINAGLVSPSVIIVVAATSIASFVLPTFSFDISARLLRFVFIIVGGTIGFLGVQFMIVLMVAILASQRSFGHPYFAPVAPRMMGTWKDYIMRSWQWQRTERPKLVGGREPIRAPKGQMPRPDAGPERQTRSEDRKGNDRT